MAPTKSLAAIAVEFAAGKLKLAGNVPDSLAEHCLPTSQLPRKLATRVALSRVVFRLSSFPAPN